MLLASTTVKITVLSLLLGGLGVGGSISVLEISYCGCTTDSQLTSPRLMLSMISA